ncbi:hypothetical protein RIR_jg42263.t1 [Rhizophagus irregularis DAOM 181602=DAOM 197198]|nr:hypothetical protein RIR_jg42263.t1 [Rhizophagus irregularis DAOM 181602=DAOM 197198]CAG8625883.1 18628_t:CDS:2 [Rhizophagus irregularis]
MYIRIYSLTIVTLPFDGQGTFYSTDLSPKVKIFISSSNGAQFGNGGDDTKGDDTKGDDHTKGDDTKRDYNKGDNNKGGSDKGDKAS